MFINLSNHNSSGWSEEQISAAKSFGEIVDIKFPEIAPEADRNSIASLAEEYVRMISEKYNPKEDVVHIMGEMCFCFQAIGKLQNLGFRCLASTTKRIVQTDENGWQKSCFSFVRFRDY